MKLFCLDCTERQWCRLQNGQYLQSVVTIHDNKMFSCRFRCHPMRTPTQVGMHYLWECNCVQIGSASGNLTTFEFCNDSLNSTNSVKFIWGKTPMGCVQIEITQLILLHFVKTQLQSTSKLLVSHKPSILWRESITNFSLRLQLLVALFILWLLKFLTFKICAHWLCNLKEV